MLVNPPALTYLNFEWPLMLHTDASKDWLEAVLEHEQDDGQMNPEAYASCYVNKHECNYGITDMEALAVVWASSTSRLICLGTVM